VSQITGAALVAWGAVALGTGRVHCQWANRFHCCGMECALVLSFWPSRIGRSKAIFMLPIGLAGLTIKNSPSSAPRHNRGGISMTMRPDPTFHASPKLAMEAHRRTSPIPCYLAGLSNPDALAS
jgi:hypothetical protein